MSMGRQILSLAVALLLLVAMAEAKTKRKGHPAEKHKGHPATAHSNPNKSAVDHHDSVKGTKHKAHKHGRKSARNRGQQQIDSARAQEIQSALIRSNYMQGQPSGKWDQATKDAMARYQADHGWQTKNIPDSRALIKLGLGPSHDHLLNPETAVSTRPESVGGGQRESEIPAHISPATADGGSDTVRVQPVSTPPAAQPSTSVVQHSSDGAGSQQEKAIPSNTPH